MNIFKIENPNLNAVLKFFLMKNNNPGRISLKKIIVVLLSLIVFLSLSAIFKESKYYIVSYFTNLVVSLFFSLLFLIICISIYINEKNKTENIISFLINLVFIITPIVFIRKFSDLNELYYLIINPIVLFFMLFCLYKLIEVKKGSDFSDLKAMNLILASILTTIVFFPIDNIRNVNIKDILDNIQKLLGYYYIVPLMMLQGLYELLSKKSK
jgi:hypothetical protein